MLRGGAFKPRTSPYTFQGLGDQGLAILREAGDETGLPVVTELMDPRHVEPVLEAADVIQIGARNSQNFLLLAEVGRADKPVLLKRGMSTSVEELLMAAEYVAKEGNERIILCERGIKTFETATRFTLDLGAVAVLKHETHLPVIVDPSHAAGRRDLVLPLARAAAAVGADGIIGTGLIGASVGLAAKRAGVEHVAGYDLGEAARETAKARGAVDEICAEEDELLAADVDLVVVAVPVLALESALTNILEGDWECAVTDVGSTKANLAVAFQDPRFVGGHPVTGSEAHGPDHATADLFDGATWFLTPTTHSDPKRYRLVHGFVPSPRATPVPIDPDAHDRLVAITSHLPHALANVLVNQAGAGRIEGHDPLAAAGGSLRDMTRVAGANPRIWVDIFLENAGPLQESLAEHRRRVEQLERALANGDAGFLARWIAEAAGNRRRMLTQAYEQPVALQRLRVHVPDRPGVLAGITQALGAARINIEDFELRHMSRERGGTLTLLVSGEDEAQRASELLEAQGYQVVAAPVLADE